MYRCESSTDYIRVRDGVEDDSPLITTYCSSVTNVVVTSSAETLSVELVSDEKKQRQGFAAQFAFVVAGSDTATGDDGLLSALLPPASGGLVVDVTTTSSQLQTVPQQRAGTLCLHYDQWHRGTRSRQAIATATF